MAIEPWHWDRLRAELEQELMTARRLIGTSPQSTYWEGHVFSLRWVIKQMRKIAAETPPKGIEDIVTD